MQQRHNILSKRTITTPPIAIPTTSPVEILGEEEEEGGDDDGLDGGGGLLDGVDGV